MNFRFFIPLLFTLVTSQAFAAFGFGTEIFYDSSVKVTDLAEAKAKKDSLLETVQKNFDDKVCS